MSSKVRNRRVPPQRHGQQPTKEEGVNNGISEDEEEDEDDLDELQDDDDGEEYQEYVPWYRQEEALPPFALTKHISSKDKNALPFRSLAMFPWDDASIELLWDGEKNSIDSDVLKWRKLISEWEGAVATASADKVYIFFLYSTRASVCISLPPDPEMKLNPVDTTNVAWAMSQSAPFEPLLIITRDRIVYIYNCVLHDMAGYLRGHGGTITSIAVHPTTPHIFCTTSRDFSTRVYDLTLTPTQTPNNPHWPPTTTPSLAGAAHGLHMTETEGSGVGRCVAVLMGGRSGGHQAAVLSAAFHPDMPLIATSGLDRNVKIWFVRPKRPDQIKREDKPLFSSGRIHRARVLSISWANHETLISHCAAAIMRKHPTDPNRKETYLHPGEIVVWRWLGFDRFFPARGSKEDWRKQETMRGCASASPAIPDYQESSSFKVLSILSLPRVPNQFNTAFMRVLTARTHDPIALILEPGTPTVRVFNVALLPPRAPRPFPPDTARNEEEIPGAGLTTPTGGRDGLSMPEMTDPETEVRRVTRSRAAREPETVRWLRLERERMEQVAREAAFAPGVEGWRFSVAGSGDGAGNYGIHAAVMGMGARVIVAVGERKSLWVFELKDAPGRGVV